MTGFGRSKQTVNDLEITVEIKSVNHRYFEFSSRVPRSFQFLDEQLKKLCSESVSRGKIEVGVQIENHAENAIELEVNETYAAAYMKALQKFGSDYHLKNDLKLSDFVGNTEIFTPHHTDLDPQAVSDAVLSVAKAALEQFVAMRALEGERLVADVCDRCDFILEKVAFVEERSPQTVAEYRAKLEQKIRELIGDTSVDEQRLLTETAIFADKIAVAEETVRLRSHIGQVRALFETGGAIGRKLDFIVQEMNRETNTIGSKAADLAINTAVVEMKSEIEKIREQIQNIE